MFLLHAFYTGLKRIYYRLTNAFKDRETIKTTTVNLTKKPERKNNTK